MRREPPDRLQLEEIQVIKSQIHESHYIDYNSVSHQDGYNVYISSYVSSHLHFSGLRRPPLDECYAPAEHEDGEPLQPAERAVQHEDGTQGRARDLQLICHLHRKTQVRSKTIDFFFFKPI